LNAPQQFALARQGAGHAPPRRPGSIRRTTSIDSHWPDGQGQPWIMTGTARDILTPPEGGAPSELARGTFRITASAKREVLEIAITPDHPRAQDMVGVRAGGASRDALAATLGELRGTPTYQLLDDYAGASLVAGWIWSQWSADWMGQRFKDGGKGLVEHRQRMTNICTGFAEGASSLDPASIESTSHTSHNEVPSLENPDDPDGWHAMPAQQGPQKRRARRIDLWHQDGLIRFDVGFQDSGSNPHGTRSAIHEYRIHGEVDPATNRLVAMQALPLILPFRECPGAAIKATRMIGQDVSTFRSAVLEALPSTLGCTHLNDVLRALADVPALARLLP
jgi:Protein of unknown function (DUF2889)